MSEKWVPTGVGRSDFVEKKSRFLGEARRTGSPDEAREIIARLRSDHPRSRHVVWAYILGPDGSLKGLSDDGEPHGTAGRPVLDPIDGQNLTNTLVTVVRYFGGVKLGTGGLVSAYGRSSREALQDMPRERLISRTRVILEIDYPVYEPVLKILEQAGGRVENEEFGAAVALNVMVPDEGVTDFRRKVIDISRGQAGFRTV